MRQPLRRYLLILALSVTLAGTAALVLVRSAASSQSGWSWNRVYRAIRDPGHTYTRWRLDRETSLVKRLIHDADILLSADEGAFSRAKPVGANGRPVEAFGTNVLLGSVMPPPGVCARAAVAVRIPTGWPLREGTKNPSGTDVEDFALDVATKLKACGVRRITVYQENYGDYWHIFDGEVPTLEAIHAQVRRLQSMTAGL